MKAALRSILIAISVAATVWAKQFPDPHGRVNDFASVLTPQTKQTLNQTISDLETATTAELFVVTVSSLDGMTVEEYGNTLFKQWGIGKKDKNNGVLVVIAPNERKMRIEVGYGLEPILPDGLAGNVIRDQMIPAFKAGDYNRGILDGTNRVAEIVRNNQMAPAPTPHMKMRVNGRETEVGALGAGLFFAVFVGIGFLMLGAGGGSKTVFPMIWGGFCGGIPMGMAMLSPFGHVMRVVMPLFAMVAAMVGFIVARKSQNIFRARKLTGHHMDGWTWGASGGSGGGSSGGSSGGGGGGGSSGGGGASGSW